MAAADPAFVVAVVLAGFETDDVVILFPPLLLSNPAILAGFGPGAFGRWNPGLAVRTRSSRRSIPAYPASRRAKHFAQGMAPLARHAAGPLRSGIRHVPENSRVFQDPGAVKFGDRDPEYERRHEPGRRARPNERPPKWIQGG